MNGKRLLRAALLIVASGLILIGGIFVVGFVNGALQSLRDEGPASRADELTEALDDALGESNRDDSGRKLTAVEETVDGLRVTWALDTHFTPGMALDAARGDAAAVLDTLAARGTPYRAVTLVGTYPLRDEDGRAQETIVLRVTYDREMIATAARGATQVLDAGHDIYIHPIFGGY